jgi:MFS transporter, DHA1 family, multidrug resistance protein
MKTVYYLAISVFLWSIALSFLAPVEELYLESFTHDYFLIGFALGIGSIGLLLFSPIICRLSDIRGRKNLILFFAFFGSFIPLLLVFSPNIQAYIFVRFLSGISAAISPLLYAFLGDLAEKRNDMGFLFGIYISGASIGGAVGSLASGYVASFAGNLSTPYFLASLFSFASIIFLLPALRMENFSPKREVLPVKTKPGSRYKMWLSAILVLTFLFSFHLSMKSLLWPIIVKEFVDYSLVPFYVAVIFASMGILAGILSPFMGKLGDKLGNSRQFFLGSLILGLVGMIMAFPGSFLPFFLICAIYSIGESVRGPSAMALVSKYTTKQNRGFIFGIIFSLSGLASFLGPAVTGYLLKFFGWNIVLFFYGFVMFAAAAGFWILLSRLS